MKSKKVIVRLAIMWLVCCLCVPFAASCEAGPSYEMSDYIPREVQLEAARKAALSSADGGLVRKANSRYNYNYVLDNYLRYYGIIYTDEDIEHIFKWASDELTKAGRMTVVPSRLVETKDLVEWLDKYFEPGALLFYKSNGNVDRCVVYLGNGKGVVRKYNDFIVGDVYISHSDSGRRTNSTGIYAVGTMWSEQKEDVQTVRISFVSDGAADAFEGRFFSLYELDADNAYKKVTDRIIFERQPGVYCIWRGDTWEYTLDEFTEMGGLHVMLVAQSPDASGQVAWSKKYDIGISDVVDANYDIQLPLPHLADTNASNPVQWTGEECMNAVQLMRVEDTEEVKDGGS